MVESQQLAHNHRSFVGRASQLAALDAMLQKALAANGQVGFVAGEPGTGKTALVQEFTRQAQQRHPELVIAFGDCSATSAISDAYLPFREILALLTGDVESSLAEGAITAENASRLKNLVGRAGDIVADYGGDLIDVFVPGAALVTKLGRQLAKRFATGAAAGASRITVDDPARVLQQFTNVVRKLAETSPLVLVIDDVHWADRASIDLLFHLSRRIEGSRLLLLATYRSNEVSSEVGGERHPLESVLNEIRRYYGDTTIDLDSGDLADRHAFVNRLLDTEPNDLPAAFREELLQHTEGHPLFTVELLQALRERGSLARDAAGVWRLAGPVDWDLVPKRSEGIIAERLGRVPADVRQLLSIAAVEGEQFTAQVVARVAKLDSRSVVHALSSVAERQHQLVRAQGVQKLGTERIVTFRFRHELFRAYLYETLNAVERIELHFEVGQALQELYAGALADIAPALADHFERGCEAESAVRYLNMAGDAAAQRHAPRQAAVLWQRALNLCDPAATPVNERRALLEKSGDALHLAGAFDEGRTALQEALDLADEPLAHARLLRKIGSCLVSQHHLDDALRHLDRAQESLPAAAAADDAATRERVQILLDRVWAHYWMNRGMEELLAEGSAFIEQHGTADDRARWLQMPVLARLRAERYRPSAHTLELAERQYAAGRQAHPATHTHCTFLYGFAHLWAGQLDTAERGLAEALQLAHKHAVGLTLVFAQTYVTVLHRLRGAFDAVLSAADHAESTARESGMGGYVAAAQANRAWALYRRDGSDQSAALAGILDMWQQTEVAYPFRWLAAWPLAAIMFERNRLRDALAALERVLVEGQQSPPSGMSEAIKAARAELDAGAAAAAHQHLERALNSAREAGEL